MENKRRKYFNDDVLPSLSSIWVNPKQPRTFGNDDLIINYEELHPPDLDDLMEEIECLL